MVWNAIYKSFIQEIFIFWVFRAKTPSKNSFARAPFLAFAEFLLRLAIFEKLNKRDWSLELAVLVEEMCVISKIENFPIQILSKCIGCEKMPKDTVNWREKNYLQRPQVNCSAGKNTCGCSQNFAQVTIACGEKLSAPAGNLRELYLCVSGWTFSNLGNFYFIPHQLTLSQ